MKKSPEARRALDDIEEYLQELVDSWFGDSPRQGDNEELDQMVELHLSRYANAMPELDSEEYSDWYEWVENQREKFYTDRGHKRLTSRQRQERGYERVRRAK